MGSLGEVPGNMLPPTQTCTKLCIPYGFQPSAAERNPVLIWLKLLLSYGVMARVVVTVAGGGRGLAPDPLPRVRFNAPAGKGIPILSSSTVFHVPPFATERKGPVATSLFAPLPSPPMRSGCQMAEAPGASAASAAQSQ